uniref:Methyltransferase type 11 domain-containing protein n=1 Tax=Globodera rostochiensis TaxID=31243 RepID=A0A914H1G7_GLORO
MDPNELTQNYVRKAYADIKRRVDEEAETAKRGTGGGFSSIARSFPFVLGHLRQIAPHSLILDIDSFTIGMDVNGAPRGKAENVDFVLADASYPPFRKGLFDAVLLVSVLHHIPNEEIRAKCLRNCLWLASAEKCRVVAVVWAKEQKAAEFSSNDVLVPYNLEDMHKLGHTVEIPFNKETTREQRIMLNAVPIRVKVPPNIRCPNYLPKNVRRRVLEVVSRVGWLYPMMSMDFYEQQLNFMANFLIDRLGKLKRIKDFSPKNISARDPRGSICEFSLKVSISVLDDAFAQLRKIYRDVLKYRYYHLFSADELERLMAKIRTTDPFGDFQPIEVEYELGNWCAAVQRCDDPKKTDERTLLP